MTDTEKDREHRKQLVEEIWIKGITDKAVLDAVGRVPRQWFFHDKSQLSNAYVDRAFPIGFGQTISQPYTVAFQTQLLNVSSEDRVLEIGTGSGYQAAILAALGCRVFSIERRRRLYNKTKQLITETGIDNISLYFGDGYEGLPDLAPFDRIIVTAAAPELPPELLKQLRTGGYLVVPVNEGPCQTMMRIIKTGETSFERQSFGSFVFVPLLKGTTQE